MSRLTRKNKSICDYCEYERNNGCIKTDPAKCVFNRTWYELQHYKDLEEQGRLIEVVRCKNCIRHNTSIMVIGFGWCDVWNQVTHDDGYCARAESKLAELKGE